MSKKNSKIIFITGVSGAGKSTIGLGLSKALEIPFFDGDDFHSESNLNKMAKGEALDDEDRFSWLQSLNSLAKNELEKTGCIIACSALKASYRTILKEQIDSYCNWVFLSGSYQDIAKRIQRRKDHFMPLDLLKSQFDILEIPTESIKVNILDTPDEIVHKIIVEIEGLSEFGFVGLGVMGASLSRNLAKKGYAVSLYNRHVDELEEDVALRLTENFKELENAKPFDALVPFVKSLAQPRKIILMVKAGDVLESQLDALIPFLSPGDILIDGGNSNYKKTTNRKKRLELNEIHFIGAGISGGEEGALKGPSIMPSGNKQAYEIVRPYLDELAAKDKNEQPCSTYIGDSGSGHFVKMVHNGIEYVEMQLIAEVYSILKSTGKNVEEIARIFEKWNQHHYRYLFEITVDILRKEENGVALIDQILDKAANKGTGNWATIAAAELGVPCTMIASALFARYISSAKEDRIQASKNYTEHPGQQVDISEDELINAFNFASIINHHQGFDLMTKASEHYHWQLNLSEIARIWTQGCIIKSDLINDLSITLKESNSILASPSYITKVSEFKKSIQNLLIKGIEANLSTPCLSEALQFFNGFTTANSTANLIQAQRDYFGAHTYQKKDDPSGKYYHTNWKKE